MEKFKKMAVAELMETYSGLLSQIGLNNINLVDTAKIDLLKVAAAVNHSRYVTGSIDDLSAVVWQIHEQIGEGLIHHVSSISNDTGKLSDSLSAISGVIENKFG